MSRVVPPNLAPASALLVAMFETALTGRHRTVMTHDPSRYWFPAKRYGWGWGVPRTWEGWAVLAVATLLIVLTGFVDSPWRWVILLVTTLLTLLICLKKGEPTRWRWGDR